MAKLSYYQKHRKPKNQHQQLKRRLKTASHSLKYVFYLQRLKAGILYYHSLYLSGFWKEPFKLRFKCYWKTIFFYLKKKYVPDSLQNNYSYNSIAFADNNRPEF